MVGRIRFPVLASERNSSGRSRSASTSTVCAWSTVCRLSAAQTSASPSNTSASCRSTKVRNSEVSSAAGRPGNATTVPGAAASHRSAGLFRARCVDSLTARKPMVACQPTGFRARSLLLGAPLIELRDLRNRPGTECKRRQAYGSCEVVPCYPLPVHDFVWIRSQAGLRMRQPRLAHGANLVFHDAAGIGGGIGEVGQYALQVTDLQPQLEPQPAPHGVGHDLVRG